MILPLIFNPVIIMGTGFNATSGQSYLLTETVTELRTLGILAGFINIACGVIGASLNLD